MNRRKLCLERLAPVSEQGDSSWGWEAGWHPEVCLTRSWHPSGLRIQGAAGRAQLEGARTKAALGPLEKAGSMGWAPRPEQWPWDNGITCLSSTHQLL